MPLEAFDTLEAIINGEGQKSRKMADTYKRIREIATKYEASEKEMNDMIKKFIPAKASKEGVTLVRD